MTKATAIFTDLPDDLYEIIVDLVAAMDQDEFGDLDIYPGLLSLSLIGCRRLLPLCRKHIFRVIKLHSFKEQGRTSKELEDFVAMSPEIVSFITELHWNLNFFEAWRRNGASSDERHPEVFFKLRKVKKLVVRGEHNTVNFKIVPNAAKIFDHFLRLPTLTTLSLNFVQDVFIAEICRKAPSLRALILNDVTFAPFDDFTISRPTPVAIEELSIGKHKGINENDLFSPLTKLRSATVSMDPFHGTSMLTALFQHCSKTLRHLKIIRQSAPVDDPFHGITDNLQSIKGENTLETIIISAPFHSESPGDEAAWKAFDSNFSNVPDDFPHLRKVYMQFVISWDLVRDANPVNNYWKRYDALSKLLNTRGVRLSMRIVYETMDGKTVVRDVRRK